MLSMICFTVRLRKRETSGNLFASTILRFVHDKFWILEISSNVMILYYPSTQPYAKVFRDFQIQDRQICLFRRRIQHSQKSGISLNEETSSASCSLTNLLGVNTEECWQDAGHLLTCWSNFYHFLHHKRYEYPAIIVVEVVILW